jgi:hypothetical protein
VPDSREREAGMTAQKLLRVVNPVLFLSLAVQAATGGMILFGLKMPFSADLFEIHEHNGILLIVLAASHLALNWGWVRVNYLR